MKVDVKLTGVDGVLKTLQSLPAEVVSKRGGPVKAALAKGARVIRDQARINMQKSIEINGADTTGTTLKSVIASRGKAPNSGRGERYLVRVKKKTFTNAKGRKTSTLMTANLLEYGSAHQPATPWLRPAFQAKAEEAINVTTKDLADQVQKIVAKLAAQNKGR
jgi:HK97 gp10 family phage protein